jgi:hypothetical protein
MPSRRERRSERPKRLLAGLATALVLLAACAEEEPPRPLSPLEIRYYLGDHLLIAHAAGTAYYLRLGRNGVARRENRDAEFGRWHTGPQGGLCIGWHERPESCAPLYRLTVSHYQWGETTFNDLDAGTRPGRFEHFEHERHGPPM